VRRIHRNVVVSTDAINMHFVAKMTRGARHEEDVAAVSPAGTGGGRASAIILA